MSLKKQSDRNILEPNPNLVDGKQSNLCSTWNYEGGQPSS